MKKRNRRKAYDLDITKAFLPKQVTKSIDEMPISIADLKRWEESKLPVYITTQNGDLLVEIKFQVPIWKALVFLSTIAAALWLIYRNLDTIISLMVIIRSWLK